MNSQLFIINISKISMFSQGVLADSCFSIRKQQTFADRRIGPHTWENPRLIDRKPVCMKAQVSASCTHLNTSKDLYQASEFIREHPKTRQPGCLYIMHVLYL